MNLSRFYRHKRLLVTGSTGYLASNLVARLVDSDCQIVRLSRPGAIFAPIKGKVEDVTGHLSDPHVWERVLEGVDFIFHFAAQTSYAGNHDPLADHALNVAPVLHLLEICRKHGYRPTILFSGTATQAGASARRPMNEQRRDRPDTIYDLHKLMAEQYLTYYAGQDFVCAATLRLANVYGPGPTSSSADRGILNLMIRKAITGQPLTIYGEGNYLRDYVYISDIVDAFLLAGIHISRLNGQPYVIGSGHGKTLAEAIRLVSDRAFRQTGIRAPVLHTNPPAPLLAVQVRDFVADSSAFADATGWQPKTSLMKGIDHTISYYLGGRREHEQ